MPYLRYGSGPKFVSDTQPEDDSELTAMTVRFWIAVALAVPVLLIAMLPMVGVPGDNQCTAAAVARLLSMDDVQAGVSPEDNHDRIKQLPLTGAIVAMAGDRINDVPALAQANVSIAMGTGTDVAIQSAGVKLVKGA